MSISRLLFFTIFITAFFNALGHAKDYQVEAIIFRNNTDNTVFEANRAAPLNFPSSESVTWKLDTELLQNQFEAIAANPDYTIIEHQSWGQESLPSAQAPIYTLHSEDIQGWFKVHAEHLLFVDMDLEFDGHRLIEKRRLKLNEKHYFDHPKFGVLLQVSRLEKEDEAEEKPTDKPTITPK